MIIKKNTERSSRTRPGFRFAAFGLILAFCIYFTWSRDFGFIWNFGVSMEPTYQNNEFLVIQKRVGLGEDWTPSLFDCVIIRDEQSNETLSKRVVALAGDTVEIKEGYVYVNEKKLKDPYGKGRIGIMLVDQDNEPLRYWETGEWGNAGDPVIQFTNQKKIIVPEGHVWVIGDNRTESWFGILPVGGIRGLVIF